MCTKCASSDLLSCYWNGCHLAISTKNSKKYNSASLLCTDLSQSRGVAHPKQAHFHDDIIKWKHFSKLLAICVGNSPVSGEFPTQRPVTRSFDVFFELRLNKRLSKQSWGWWFEMPFHPLWHHCNICVVVVTGSFPHSNMDVFMSCYL